jgi:hypothetical protein
MKTNSNSVTVVSTSRRCTASSIDALLVWLDESIKEADLALRDELDELRGLTEHLGEDMSVIPSPTDLADNFIAG